MRVREKECMKAQCHFLFLVWSIFVSSPFGRRTKKADSWRRIFFLWASACVICRGKCFFCFLFFLPQTVVYEKASVKKYSRLQKKVIKVKVYKKYSALLLSWENAELCMCLVLEVNSLLWSGNVATVCVAQHRKADGFLSRICPLFNYFPTLSFEVYTLIALLLKELLLFSETHSKWGTMPRMNLFPKLRQRETALCIPAELAKFVVQR